VRDTSRPRRRAQPFAASRDHISVTVILPPSASRGVGEVVVVEMSGCLPTCDVAIALGRCHLPLPSLAMSGGGMKF